MKTVADVPFRAAHESLIARLEREGKAEEITALRAERDELAAALRNIPFLCARIVGMHGYKVADGDNWLGPALYKIEETALAALAKVDGK